MKKKKVSLMPLVVILILIILTAAGLYYYKYIFLENNRYLGKWVRHADLSEYVEEAMGDWFGDALLAGVVSYGNEQATIEVKLSVDVSGGYTETISDSEYEKALVSAKKMAEEGLRDFLEKRLEAADATPDKTGKSLDELAQEVLGMSISEYIDEYAPELLPNIDELREDILYNGTYKVSGDIITLITPGKTTAIDYVATDKYFVLNNETEDPSAIGMPIGQDESNKKSEFKYPVVYTKK